MHLKVRHLVLLLTTLVSLPSCGQYRSDLAFVSDRDGSLNLYLTDTDTSFFLQLTGSPDIVWAPVWSPDGQMVFFTIYREEDRNIFRVNADGSGLVQVTFDSTETKVLDIAPDGRRLLVQSTRDEPTGEIYIMDTEGRNARRLTQNQYIESGAGFFPDGQRIVTSIRIKPPLQGEHAGTSELFIIDPTGRIIRQVTTDGGFNALPAPSPDGTRVAFHGCRGGPCDIFVVDTSGTVRNLTNGDADSRWPRWSPDGRWILYTRSDNDNSDVWVMQPDGSRKRAVVSSPFRDEIAVFRPSGR